MPTQSSQPLPQYPDRVPCPVCHDGLMEKRCNATHDAVWCCDTCPMVLFAYWNPSSLLSLDTLIHTPSESENSPAATRLSTAQFPTLILPSPSEPLHIRLRWTHAIPIRHIHANPHQIHTFWIPQIVINDQPTACGLPEDGNDHTECPVQLAKFHTGTQAKHFAQHYLETLAAQTAALPE